MLICDKCNGKVIDGSLFCPHCGDAITDADKPESTLAESHAAQVQLSFGRSTSASYERAVEICRNLPTYTEAGEGKTLTHSIRLPITEVELLINLYELVGNWKSSAMLINGHPSKKSDLVYHAIGCYRGRQKAFNREQHCFGEQDHEFNIWGCKRLEMPVYPWGGGWLDHGSMDQSGIWHFDKTRIRHELEVKIHENELCPALDRKGIIETLERLPDTVNPRTDPRWVYHTEHQEVGLDWREVAVGIKPNIKKINQYVVGEFKPKWQEYPGGDQPREKHVIELRLTDADQQSGALPPAKTNRSGCALFLVLFSLSSILAAVSISGGHL